jgi:transposase
MNKHKGRHTDAGGDVSKDVVDFEARRDGGAIETACFENTPAGHKRVVSWLTKRGRTARVVLESTGTYSLDLALALHRAKGIEVMVANPRATKDFARALMQRSKTDLTAATALREFCERMRFVPWQPPEPHLLALRGISRRITALTAERTRELNRLHALRASAESSPVVVNDIEVNVRHLERRAELLGTQALELIEQHSDLKHAFERVTSIVGIADTSAIQLLPEILVLPADMTVRQWVAHAGLDPRAFQSGTSVAKPARISKVGNARIRRALFMPALVAVQRSANVKAFFEKLLARGKKPIQAYVAVMRKLLHSIYGVLKRNENFNAEKFYALTDHAA